MSLADNLYIYQEENVSILSNQDYRKIILSILNFFKSNGIDIPKHTVLIYPPNFYDNSNEYPVTYINQNLIFLFPLLSNKYPIEDFILYQYLHELCHLVIGEFEQPIKWVSELLACSCNYFFFPKDEREGSFYDVNIDKTLLSFEHNKIHFSLIENQLSGNPYLVYNGNYPIKSALMSYKNKCPKFNFIELLKEFISLRNKPKDNAIIKVKQFFM